MVDFDADCMADLFVTVQDESGNKYYQIYQRREGDPAKSFCLV
jgi:hypothetical protein